MSDEVTTVREESGAAPETAAHDFPKLLTVSTSPHIKAADNTRTIMADVLIALIPALVWSCYLFSMRALLVCAVTVAASIIFEFLYQKLMKKPVTVLDLSAAVTGLLLSYNLPASIPIWMPIVGSFFAIVVVKQLYGGIGKNIMNPALCARAFLMLAWPSQMTSFPAPRGAADAVASATPLSSLKAGVLPLYSTQDLFFGNIPGSLGEVSALLLLLGGLYLLLRRVITWHTPVAYIGTVALIAYFFPQADSGRVEFMLAEILSGGVILAAIFMATDYATTPVTATGRLLFGFGCGLITILIRYFGTYPEGASFSVLIMNTLVYYIEKWTKPVRFGGLKHGK